MKKNIRDTQKENERVTGFSGRLFFVVPPFVDFGGRAVRIAPAEPAPLLVFVWRCVQRATR